MPFTKGTLKMNIVHNIVKFTVGLPIIVALTIILLSVMGVLIIAGNFVCLIGAIISGDYSGFRDLRGMYEFTWEGLCDLWEPVKPR